MLTMCQSSGLGTKPIVGFLLHLGQLLSTCVPFSLGASEDTLKGDVINWGVLWAPVPASPSPGTAFSCVHAFYFFIFCLSTSIVFGATYIKFLPPGSTQNRVITAAAFAFVAAALYATEAFCIISSLEAWSGSSQPSQACSGDPENYADWFFITVISSPTSISISQPLFVVVDFICFLLEPAMNFIFNRKLDGQPRRSSDVSCSNRCIGSECAGDQRLGCGRPIQLPLDEADTEHLACEAI
ncbi:PREDICTED: myeloid-associated differentiation marker-like, partial [Capra hircus]|uniref:myeloid-associated differentiation marker-like n=1 Tax=Capra hircus TaxID=9925 RepID=UPI000846FDEC